MFKILFAPLQGYTTKAYRDVHAEFAGGIDAYYAPFLRVENGIPRAKDLRDLENSENGASGTADPKASRSMRSQGTASAAKAVPQIIANGVEEFRILANALQQRGFEEIDFNMGCPFPMQVNHHRGAGLLNDANTVAAIMEEIAKLSSACGKGGDQGKSLVKFSVKMRLGENSASEAFALLPVLNEAPLAHITLHPRLGKQQYKGALDFEAFERFYAECKHPLYLNGDIATGERIRELESKYPKLAGVMIGRGLLANPALATEYKSGRIWSENERRTLVLKMHTALMDFACRTYQGDSQILSHLQSFWEYQESSVPKKIFKKIRKAGNIEEYRAAVKLLDESLCTQAAGVSPSSHNLDGDNR